ncbi:phosphoribosylanthranilate isomerase [Ancylobacter mangrovi]|uniref:phosphoribosylanthranilate isomerase n=1 Tax=Ancylobacter mangrovi TaxID=2972472 RepID=UPI00216389DC|nr:phosphoribosylanthranilate isomerase [Ancylobacter mangrovi]MCS0502421.1 phosphoribosylanthranilate isomerase [Ancylobacter mangrovi]
MSLEIKICGLSTLETLDAALGAGADMVGVVFFAPSPRNVDLATARRLAAHARGEGASARVAALTVDAEDEALAAIVEAVRPDLLQLHGRETPERVAAVRARFGLPVMKAVGIATRADLGRLGAYEGVADRLLLDAKAPKGAALPGGNGVPFDWALLSGLELRVPYMLSGGLDPSNVGAALRLAHPSGVDVSSGVESAPGLKDPARIEAFIRAARAAEREAREAGTHEIAGRPADPNPAAAPATASPANQTSPAS